jgi:hypothetical protein
MTPQPNQSPRLEDADPRELERRRRLFLLARAQLAAGRTEPLRPEAERQEWGAQRSRFA